VEQSPSSNRRTPGAEPPTIHSTRNFAILHAAIVDAVNNIDGFFSPYLVRLSDVSRQASQPAAADQAGHDVLVALYPAFQTILDAELQQDLAQIQDGKNKNDGITVGQTVAAQILAFRSNDGSGVTPPSFVPGNDPGDYHTNSRLPISHRQISRSGLLSLPLLWRAPMNLIRSRRQH
jgi:hypothetical protein